MKLLKYFLIGLIAFIMAGMSTKAGTAASEYSLEEIPAPDTLSTDSTEYKLIVFDTGFENWYLQRNKPSWYHTESYYEHWNQRYVNEWNYRYSLGDGRFEDYINYNPAKDYGIKVEHKLYYYFKYFQEKNNVSLR